MKRHHICHITTVNRILAAILLVASLLTLVSCESKTKTAESVLIDEFEDIWVLGGMDFTEIELFSCEEVPCYYIGYDTVNDGESLHVNAIIATDPLDESKVEHYIHSTDFERTERNKKYYQAYLDAKEAETVYVFSAEELAEIQQNLYDKLGTDFIE